jgi:uncharacterized protein
VAGTLLILALFQAEIPDRPPGMAYDRIKLLSQAQMSLLEDRLRDFERQTGNELAVLIVGTTGVAPIEQFALDVFNRWGVGKKGKDNGVLLLIAKEDRRMRIQTGRGAEGELTDLESSYILQDLTPYFQAGRWFDGIMTGVAAIQQALASNYVPQSGRVSGRPEAGRGVSLCFILMLLFVFLGPFGWLGRRRRFWGGPFIFIGGGGWRGGGGWGGGGGGGFGGFGGGMSGGGGASGRW